MTIPDPNVPFAEVLTGVAAGKTYWAMRGTPDRRSRVEVYFASLFEDENELVPGVDYVGGYWADQMEGEEDWFELDDAVEQFQVDQLLWHETAGQFEPGYTPEYTVAALTGVEMDPNE